MKIQKENYRKYSTYLREKYGEKVYKLPVNLPITCPNRDGTCGSGGCSFCGEVGTGFESLSNSLSVKEQLMKNMVYIREKYKAKKFIAYYQNFSNTYMPLEQFKTYINESLMTDIVEISISTRPDCIREEYLEFLYEFSNQHNISITIELGLQTVNYHSLIKVNRGHTLGEFIDAVLRIQKYGFEVCAHLILNLPWDSEVDVIENAKILSALSINQVKLHSLYIVKNTALGNQYEKGEFTMISPEEYIQRVILFLEHLSPHTVVQRLIGRAPKENTLFVNWNMSWWKIRDTIEAQMEQNNRYQGKAYNYTNGKALKTFF